MELFEFEERLKEHAQKAKSIISTPFDLKIEINKVEEKNMNKTEKISWFKRTGAVAAMVAVCLVTVVNATPIKGFFKDIMRFDGAVVGTEYANATNEVKIIAHQTEITEEKNVLPLEIEFIDNNVEPFKSIKEISIVNYKIVDKNHKEISFMEEKLVGTVDNGKVLINIPLEVSNLIDGDIYFVEINNLKGLSKADAPLEITGNWNIKFVK